MNAFLNYAALQQGQVQPASPVPRSKKPAQHLFQAAKTGNLNKISLSPASNSHSQLLIQEFSRTGFSGIWPVPSA
jgi:hypothetical protein